MIASIFYEGTTQFRRSFVFALCIVLTIIAFMNTLHFDFVHDDMTLIVYNPSIARWDNLWDYFFSSTIAFQAHSISTPYFRPLLEIINRFQFLIFGMNPSGFHLFNVLIHACNGFLVYLVLQRMSIKAWMALTVAIIFLIHPVQTQAVAAIAGVSNLVTAFFILLSLKFFVAGRGKSIDAVGAILFYICALLCKEHAIVLPVLLSFYGLVIKDRSIPFSSTRYQALGGIWIVTAIYLLWRFVFVSHGSASSLGASNELVLRLLTIPQTLLMYLRLIVWPSDLHYYRSVDSLSPWVPYWIGLGGVVLTQIWAWVKCPDCRPWILFGWGWFLLFLGPVLNIVPLINEYSFLAASEHFLYLPMIGVVLLLIIFVEKGIHQQCFISLKTWLSCTIILIGLLLALTMRQNEQWQSELTLFQRTVQYQPQLGRVQQLMGNAYINRNRLDEALVHYRAGEKIFQGYVDKVENKEVRELYGHFLKSIYTGIGHVFLKKDDILQSIVYYEKALSIPGHFPGESDYMLYYNLSIHYHRLGQADRAQAYFDQAQQLISQ